MEQAAGNILQSRTENEQSETLNESNAADQDHANSDLTEIVIPFHYVYILLCHDGTLYTGYTNNLLRRLRMHNAKRAAKYTRNRTPVQLVYHEVFLSKSEALKREYAIKQCSRSQKLELIYRQEVSLVAPKKTAKAKKS